MLNPLAMGILQGICRLYANLGHALPVGQLLLAECRPVPGNTTEEDDSEKVSDSPPATGVSLRETRGVSFPPKKP